VEIPYMLFLRGFLYVSQMVVRGEKRKRKNEQEFEQKMNKK